MNAWLKLMRPSLKLSSARMAACGGLIAMALCATPGAAQADTGTALSGLSESGWPGDSAWSRWQGRVGWGSPVTGTAALTPSSDTLSGRSSLSLLGDYYFTQNGLAAQDSYGGGFRATGGLFVGPRSGLWLATPTSLSSLSSGWISQRRGFGLLSPTTPESLDGGSVPYVGVGYTGLKSLRATGGGWGFSADVGLMALQPRSVVRLGQQGLGELQLSPLLQLGVSYSF